MQECFAQGESLLRVVHQCGWHINAQECHLFKLGKDTASCWATRGSNIVSDFLVNAFADADSSVRKVFALAAGPVMRALLGPQPDPQSRYTTPLDVFMSNGVYVCKHGAKVQCAHSIRSVPVLPERMEHGEPRVLHDGPDVSKGLEAGPAAYCG